MGRQRSKTGNALQLRIDQKGEVNYDVVVREGARKVKKLFATKKTKRVKCEGKHIFTQLQEAEKMDVDDPMTLARPSREEAAELIKKAREGMEKQLKGDLLVRIFYAAKIFQVLKNSFEMCATLFKCCKIESLKASL